LDLMCDMFTLKLLKVKNRVREREKEKKMREETEIGCARVS